LLYLLKQFDKKCYQDLDIGTIKLKIVNYLSSIKDTYILTDINIFQYPNEEKCKEDIFQLQKITNIEYIDYVDINDKSLIFKLDKLILYLIKLNNLYKKYIIKIEEYNSNIINELYKIKFN
jgi:hypothetical protein